MHDKGIWGTLGGLTILAAVVYIAYLSGGKHSMAENTTTTAGANRLQFEQSPYLLQHADNPVNWYPWGEEAFAAARQEDKPIFLSIGYSTCHWCHVMEHESFEDPQVAALMNETFINIKVDREERPDIDNIYMTVCQMMTKGGGWPLTIVMTPEKKPFFAGTYFPRESQYGRIGMVELIPRIKSLWQTERANIDGSADQITATLSRATITTPGEELDRGTLDKAYTELRQRFDGKRGGFGRQPKFPTPHNLLFLLRYYQRTGETDARRMAEKTLSSMRRGGIYDHVGFGFHRYSTDEQWLVPHFEKMLYDQALLAMAYTEAYQVSGRDEYANTAREIFTYVLRDMMSPAGGFYSAEDADSEGEEGKFYLWTEREIRDLLGADAELFIDAYAIDTRGNFVEQGAEQVNGLNIPHLPKLPAALASEHGLSATELSQRLESARSKLFAAREKRIHPHKDDKILADWNGLMIAALAKGAQVFDDSRYAEAAARAAQFILRRMRTTEGRLLHRFRDGHAGITGNCDDYAFVIWGLLELYEATFDVGYLKNALELNDHLLGFFWDEEAGGFYFTADDAENLIIRHKEIYDGAVPSGNSAAMLNLLRLGRITARPEYENKARMIGRAFAEQVDGAPSAHTLLLCAVDFVLDPGREVLIVGQPGAADTEEMLRALRQRFLPNKVVLFRRDGDSVDEIVGLAEFAENHTSIDGKATAYVCANYACKLPTTEIATMIKLLSADSGS